MNGTMGSIDPIALVNATHAPLTRHTGSPEDCVSDAVTKLQFKLDSCETNDLPRETSFQDALIDGFDISPPKKTAMIGPEDQTCDFSRF